MADQRTLWDQPEPASAPEPPTRAAPRILRVTDLNRRVRSLLDTDAVLADVWVEGEVSQPSYPASGHCFSTDGKPAKCGGLSGSQDERSAYFLTTGLPSASRTVTSPRFRARIGASVLERSPTTTQVSPFGSSALAAALTCSGVIASISALRRST